MANSAFQPDDGGYLFEAIAINRYPTINITIPAGYGLCLPMNLEIASGNTYELASNAVLEIT